MHKNKVYTQAGNIDINLIGLSNILYDYNEVEDKFGFARISRLDSKDKIYELQKGGYELTLNDGNSNGTVLKFSYIGGKEVLMYRPSEEVLSDHNSWEKEKIKLSDVSLYRWEKIENLREKDIILKMQMVASSLTLVGDPIISIKEDTSDFVVLNLKKNIFVDKYLVKN